MEIERQAQRCVMNTEGNCNNRAFFIDFVYFLSTRSEWKKEGGNKGERVNRTKLLWPRGGWIGGFVV